MLCRRPIPALRRRCQPGSRAFYPSATCVSPLRLVMPNWVLLFLLPIRANDLVAGGKPDLSVRRDVLQRLVEVSDAVRHPDQERMQRDAHDPAACRRLII